MNPNELLAECFHHQYASVFILDQLPLELDGARIDNDNYTVLLDQALVSDFSSLGYHVVRVPVLSPQERLAFVLERLSERRLIVPLEGEDSPSNPGCGQLGCTKW